MLAWGNHPLEPFKPLYVAHMAAGGAHAVFPESMVPLAYAVTGTQGHAGARTQAGGHGHAHGRT